MTGHPQLHPTHRPPPARPVALHTRIREDLRSRIVSGVLRPDDQVPSESALMGQYGVSRITVRHALGALEQERLIFKVPGKGSFVAKTRPVHELHRLQGFAEALDQLGFVTTNRLLELRDIAADDDVAERLAVPPGATVTHLQRVRLVDGQPVALDLTWVPQAIGARLAGEDLARRDVFSILENDYGIALGHADLAIHATVADGVLADLLQVRAGSPVLHIERLTHTRDGQPLDYEHLYSRTDHLQYRLRIHRSMDQTA